MINRGSKPIDQFDPPPDTVAPGEAVDRYRQALVRLRVMLGGDSATCPGPAPPQTYHQFWSPHCPECGRDPIDIIDQALNPEESDSG